MKKHLSTIILIFIFLIGLSLLLYPSVSNYWNSFHASRAIASYSEQTAVLDEETYRQIWEAAETYNQRLAKRGIQFSLSAEQEEEYHNLLNLGNTGVMGYIEIEKLGVSLPIYHGTDDAILQIAAGHLDWSSLPVGGTSTHCVLSGHRGLPSAQLFTDLDQLVEGDTFVLYILNEMLTYEVDQILIVEPEDLSALQIEEGRDLCTLVTCTPYGINTHRLLVRGHRIDNAVAGKLVHVTSEAVQIEPVLVAPVVAAPILLVLLIVLLIPKRKKNRR